MKLKYLFNLILFLYFFILISTKSYSDTLDKISISGNIRISDETIFTFLPIKINDQISINQINEITKLLYETSFFKDISVELLGNELKISVIENPIIQNVSYNGIKSDSLKEFITKNLKLMDRSFYVDLHVKQDSNKILDNLKKKGYYFSQITPKIENLEDNKINLIYDIFLGDKAKINKISFIGNKIFKDRVLKNIILSEEYKFWKFISGKKFLNQDLVDFDKRLLTNYYLNKGYYNVNISSSFAKITDDDSFELIYNIDAGKRIFFGDLTLNLPINYEKENFRNLNNFLKKLKNEPYSLFSIEKIIEQIDILALYEQYEAIKVDVNENLIDTKLNINFLIQETKKTFIKRINILGNNVTRENVIRNQLEIDEGDFYNEILFNKSINNIKGLRFFKTVESKLNADPVTGDKIIDISVEEQATGEIGASAGVGTSGESVGFFVKENNYLGKGLGLAADINLSTESVKGSFSVTNPNFNDTDKLVYANIETSEIDKLKTFGYKTSRTGFGFGTRFEILDDLDFGIGNSNYYQKIETDSTASALQQKQEGDYWDTFLNFDFIYDKRNQRFKPTDGFISEYNIELPLISDTNTLSNVYDYKYFTELFDNNVTSIGFYTRTSNSLTNDNIKLTERNFLPGKRLRGFKSGGIGPKDGNDFIGGNYASSVNFTTTLPQISSNNQNIDFVLFLDAGNVWGVDYDSTIDDSNKIRSATGIGVEWFTPVGPLSFSLSQPITKASTDSTETFRFNLGTTF